MSKSSDGKKQNKDDELFTATVKKMLQTPHKPHVKKAGIKSKRKPKKA